MKTMKTTRQASHIFDDVKVGSGNGIFAATNRDELKLILDGIISVGKLSQDEEVALAEKIQRSPKDRDGKPTDRRSVNRLVEANLGFLVSVAKLYDFKDNCLTINDLVNEGSIGMIEAAESFDPTRGFKFVSYAIAFIRMRIINALEQKNRIVRDRRRETPIRYSSLDAPIADDDDTTLGDILCTSTDSEAFRNESLLSDIMRVFNKILKPKEMTIVCTLLGIGTPAKKMWEIALQLGTSRERVRQISEMALQKVRNDRKAKALLAKYQA
jgi:RNA polymerase primary sigma factor